MANGMTVSVTDQYWFDTFYIASNQMLRSSPPVCPIEKRPTFRPTELKDRNPNTLKRQDFLKLGILSSAARERHFSRLKCQYLLQIQVSAGTPGGVPHCS